MAPQAAGEPRLLVLTASWPSADRPSAGVFVRDRVAGVPGVTVVGYRRYDVGGLQRFARLVRDALTVRGRFDGVEAHFLLPVGPLALLVATLRRLPLVVYAHGSDVGWVARRSRLHWWLARLVARHADAVVTNSSDTARHVRALGREPIVIPPGVDLGRFRPSPRPPRRRVLYIGGKQAHKGWEIARELADTLVGGRGLPEIEPADMPALMAAHDVVLVPSYAEPFGLVAAEAIASGRWVVARAVGGLRDIVTDGVNGTLVDDGDFAGALARVPDYDPFAVAASADRFDIARERQALAALWRQVLDRRRRSS